MRWLSLIALGACVPPMPPLDGAACDDDHACGPGYACIENPCSSIGPSQNLLAGGDFEGGIDGWKLYAALASTQETVRHSGVKAAHLRADPADTGSTFGLASLPESIRHQSGQLHCADAWVHRGNISAKVQIILRRYSGTDWEDSPQRLTSLDPEWERVATRIRVEPPFDTAVTVRVTTDWASGGEFYVDDVRVWPAPPRTCERE